MAKTSARKGGIMSDDKDINKQIYSSNGEEPTRIIEALLFASTEPLNEELISNKLPPETDVRSLIDLLVEQYSGRGINLVSVAGGWAFRTAPDLSNFLKSYRTVKRQLSRAALETLAIISYYQPVTRPEIEEIRGVSLSRGTLDQLLQAGWIKPKGRRRTPGRPGTWVTTDEFLIHFGLESLDDLPGVDELKAAGLLQINSIIVGQDQELPLGEATEEDIILD